MYTKNDKILPTMPARPNTVTIDVNAGFGEIIPKPKKNKQPKCKSSEIIQLKALHFLIPNIKLAMLSDFPLQV